MEPRQTYDKLKTYGEEANQTGKEKGVSTNVAQGVQKGVQPQPQQRLSGHLGLGRVHSYYDKLKTYGEEANAETKTKETAKGHLIRGYIQGGRSQRLLELVGVVLAETRTRIATFEELKTNPLSYKDYSSVLNDLTRVNTPIPLPDIPTPTNRNSLFILLQSRVLNLSIKGSQSELSDSSSTKLKGETIANSSFFAFTTGF